MKPPVRNEHGKPCWIVASDSVEVALTRHGGHMAPVTFCRNTTEPVQPYYISPWQGEHRSDVQPPVLEPLRGDFFCMPFGGANRYRGEDHTPHGETATGTWRGGRIDTAGGVTTLTATMKVVNRPGLVTKRIRLLDGHNTVYIQHELTGFRGKMCLGHHATLAVPEEEGALRVTSSRFDLGMTCSTLFSDPAAREYQALAIGARFKDLARVPTLWKDPDVADCTRFPGRLGYTDLLALMKKPSRDPAWMAAVNARAGYLWFSLKDAAVLPATVFWISNRGRHGAPWDGRNRCLGLEDVCAYFADGLTASARKNLLNDEGFATTLTLSPKRPTHIHAIEGVARVPKRFGAVKAARFAAGEVTFVDEADNAVTAPVRHDFLAHGRLDV